MRDQGPTRSSAIEVLGPAGAGKSTVISILCGHDPRFREGVAIAFSTKVLALVRALASFVPAYLACYPHTRWFSREELARAVYLEGGLRALQREDGAVILDHGPVFMLAMLKAFGPELVATKYFARWSRAIAGRWATALDTILWLDAEDALLIDRIEGRTRHHVVKGRPADQACVFLGRCRAAFEEIVAEMSASHALRVLRADTSTASAEEIAQWFRSSVDSPEH